MRLVSSQLLMIMLGAVTVLTTMVVTIAVIVMVVIVMVVIVMVILLDLLITLGGMRSTAL